MNRYLKQIVHTQFFSILNIVFGFSTLFLLLKYMPKQQYGEYVLIQGFISIAGLIFSQNLYSYARLHIPGAKKSLQYGYLKTVISVVFIGYIFSLVSIEIFDKKYLFWAFFEIDLIYLKYVLFMLGISLVNAEFFRFMIATKKIEIKNYAQFIQKIIILMGVLVILFFYQISLKKFLCLYLFSQVVIFIYMILYIEFKELSSACFMKDVLLKGYMVSLPLLPIGLMSVALNYTDTLMIAKFIGKQAVAAYGFASQITYIAMMLIGSSVVLTIFPYATEAHNRGDIAERTELFIKMLKYGALLSLFFYVVIYVGSQWFINLLQLSQYEEVPSYLYILALFPLLQVFYSISSHHLQLMKVFSIQVYFALFVMIENSILNYFFIKYIGAIGAAYASLLSYVTLAVLYTAVSITKDKSFCKRLRF